MAGTSRIIRAGAALASSAGHGNSGPEPHHGNSGRAPIALGLVADHARAACAMRPAHRSRSDSGDRRPPHVSHLPALLSRDARHRAAAERPASTVSVTLAGAGFLLPGAGVVLVSSTRHEGPDTDHLSTRLPLANGIDRVEQHQDVQGEVVANHPCDAHLEADGQRHGDPGRQAARRLEASDHRQHVAD